MATINGTFNSLIAGTLSGTVATPGSPGVGVPAGGSAGQVLAKVDGVSYNTEWVNVTASAAWGTITGTLSAQTDLQNALDAKQNVSAMSAYLTKAGNLAGLTDLSVARDNLQLGTLNNPVFAGVQITGAGASVANLGATFLTLSQPGYGMFTIQPSQGIVFPDATIQTTAYPGPPGATTWGSIGGTLSNQTDLQNALNAKYDTSNPSGFITSSALTGYATESWVTSQGYLTSVGFYPLTQDLGFDTYSNDGRLLIDGVYDPTSSGAASSRLNFGSTTPSSPLNGDFWTNGTTFKYTLGGTTYDIASESYVTTRGYITSSALSSYAPLASPSLTGTPLSTTAAADTNTTQIATTAYVVGQAGSATPLVNGTAAVGTSLRFARQDHVHGTDTTRAPLASPTFTGTVTIPAGASISGFAPLASPTFTGTPSLPTGTTGVTQTAGNNTTAVATTAFVAAAVPAFATNAETVLGSSTNTIVSPNGIMAAMMANEWRHIYPNIGQWTSATTGSGGGLELGMYHRNVRVLSGSTGSALYSTSVAGTSFNGFWQANGSAANGFTMNWSKIVRIKSRVWMQNSTATNYVFRIKFGNGFGSGTRGNLNFRGIGIRKTSGNAVLELCVHNGTTFTAVNSSYSVPTTGSFDYEIVSDGAGNVSLFINGSSTAAATTTGGPTGTDSTNLSGWQVEVDGTGPSTNIAFSDSLGSVYTQS